MCCRQEHWVFSDTLAFMPRWVIYFFGQGIKEMLEWIVKSRDSGDRQPGCGKLD